MTEVAEMEPEPKTLIVEILIYCVLVVPLSEIAQILLPSKEWLFFLK